jgi:S1-C subfamily serine protease
MERRNIQMLRNILLVFMCLIIFSSHCYAVQDVRESIVKIYCVKNSPDYDNPWNMRGLVSISGSGCIISDKRILTNAHVVSDKTYIQVRLHGKSEKYKARLLAVSHEADLALLTVDDLNFFKGVSPLKFGRLPEIQDKVTVYGFPEGGDALSTTTGIISRIEHQIYAHSFMNLLAAQIDAAVNSGNSGGPAMVGDQIVGVVMQSLIDSENTNYIVPAPIIEHFLQDMKDGRYDGFPQLGLVPQKMENNNLRKMYGLVNGLSGVLTVNVTPGTPAEGMIYPGDIITSLDGHPVANDNTVEFRKKERTRMGYYVQKHQIGEMLNLKVIRKGREIPLRIALNSAWGKNRLVPMMRYDVRPTYFICGGLVFCPLSLNYLLTWGEDWDEDAPSNLLNYFSNGKLREKDEEVVIVIKVLAADLNSGYDDFTDERIVKVNGKKINNIRELIAIVENSTDAPFLVFENENKKIIALDRDLSIKEQKNILRIYNIPKDRSRDLMSISSTE